MHKQFALLHKLQDGLTHSGQTLADEIGITRAAVWHQIKQLQEMGIDIHTVSGKGYRLPGGYEFLDSEKIGRQWPEHIAAKLGSIEVEQTIDSTNERLIKLAASEDIHGRICLAEYQTAGRGRRGASWLAPPGSGLCLSIAWRFQTTPAEIGALSLVIGLAVQRAVSALGAKGVGVKWPNDLYIEENPNSSSTRPAKIAGILIEMRSELAGPSMVVIGLGLNLSLSTEIRAKIDQQASDLASVCEGPLSRNETAGRVIQEILLALEEFSVSGFKSFREQWDQVDFLNGRSIKLHVNKEAVEGIARGVDENGFLKLAVGGLGNTNLQTFFAGHVELL